MEAIATTAVPVRRCDTPAMRKPVYKLSRREAVVRDRIVAQIVASGRTCQIERACGGGFIDIYVDSDIRAIIEVKATYEPNLIRKGIGQLVAYSVDHPTAYLFLAADPSTIESFDEVKLGSALSKWDIGVWSFDRMPFPFAGDDSVDDYRQAIAHHSERARHHMVMANEYARRGTRRFKIQLNLPFGDAA